jgi:hypothetical protein
MRISAISGVLVVALATTILCAARPNDAAPNASLTTQERMYSAGWWPTKGEASRKDYAGEAACAKCHGDIAAVQHTTPMYHAASPGGSPNELTLHPGLTFREAAYSYLFEKSPSGMNFRVRDGAASDFRPVAWAFGNAEIGQTYLLKQKDGYIESRLSYYTKTGALDVTTGHSEEPPSNLHEALGHELSPDTAEHCFNCHTTEATMSDNFVPEKAIAGVTCEACHGPGAQHVAAMSAGLQTNAANAMVNPEKMSPSDSVDFCGSCHRTFADVAVFMPANLGVISVRFQPYRLEKSKCWGKSGDARITCVACHDPHRPLVHELAAYDSKCLACHRTGATSKPGATAAACKVATKDCASCHMPKYVVPQTHASFTDHDIRIVQAGQL